MQKKITVTIKIPDTPSYIGVSETVGGIDIAEFSDEELKEIGKQWTQDLLEKAEKRRNLK